MCIGFGICRSIRVFAYAFSCESINFQCRAYSVIYNTALLAAEVEEFILSAPFALLLRQQYDSEPDNLFIDETKWHGESLAKEGLVSFRESSDKDFLFTGILRLIVYISNTMYFVR